MFKSNEVTITDKFREDRSSQHDSRRPLDRYQEYDNRLKAAEKALNGLLKPNNKELSPRERMIYQQAMEELKILNTDNYAINAHLSEEWALYAARRAHLKALFRPGE